MWLLFSVCDVLRCVDTALSTSKADYEDRVSVLVIPDWVLVTEQKSKERLCAPVAVRQAWVGPPPLDPLAGDQA